MTSTAHATATAASPARSAHSARDGSPTSSGDVVDLLLGTEPGGPLDRLRGARPEARANAQRSFEALLEPVDTTHVSLLERRAVAAFVVGLHRLDRAEAFYADLLRVSDGRVADAVAQEVARGLAAGPYGAYREPALADESTTGPVFAVGANRDVLGGRLAAALEHSHLLVLRPREASPRALEALAAAGWSTDGIVTLSQLVAFLAFQVRVVHGLAELGAGALLSTTEGEGQTPPAEGGAPAAEAVAAPGADTAPAGAEAAAPAAGADTAPVEGTATPASRWHPAAARVTTHPDLRRPAAFTRDQLGWVPWLEPLPVEQLTERHLEGLVDRRRADNDYFRLLVRDPETLAARTRTDNDIFYNTRGGLPRAERELAATAASRRNGCVFCASVHARFAAHHSRRPDDVQRLLDEGTGAELGPRWDAVVAASVALTDTPAALGADEIARLRSAGLDDLEIADLVHGAAFFNWANRLMLSLGEPSL